MLDTLAPERRILLLIIAFRLLYLLWYSLDTPPRDQPSKNPDWRAGVQILCFAIPLFVVLFLARQTARDLIPLSDELVLASGVSVALVIAGSIFALATGRLADAPESESAPRTQGGVSFWMENLFQALAGMLVAFALVGTLVISPGLADDVDALAHHATSMYLILFAIQLLFIFPGGVPDPSAAAPQEQSSP
jgi:hypothetical protein